MELLVFCTGFLWLSEPPNILYKFIPIKPKLIVNIDFFGIGQINVGEATRWLILGAFAVTIIKDPIKLSATDVWLRVGYNALPLGF